VRIVSARVIDRTFVPRRRVVSGHPMSIELQYEVDPAVADDTVLELQLANDQGTILFAADTAAVGPPPAPAGKLRFSFANLALGGGYVAIRVSARRRDGTLLLARQRVAELDVIVGAATSGVVYMPVKARFDALPPVTLVPAPPAQ
jgi:hypothetical protein